MSGPPFSVPRSKVLDLFADRYRCASSSAGDVIEGHPHFKQRGLMALEECRLPAATDLNVAHVPSRTQKNRPPEPQSGMRRERAEVVKPVSGGGRDAALHTWTHFVLRLPHFQTVFLTMWHRTPSRYPASAGVGAAAMARGAASRAIATKYFIIISSCFFGCVRPVETGTLREQ